MNGLNGKMIGQVFYHQLVCATDERHWETLSIASKLTLCHSNENKLLTNHMLSQYFALNIFNYTNKSPHRIILCSSVVLEKSNN